MIIFDVQLIWIALFLQTSSQKHFLHIVEFCAKWTGVNQIQSTRYVDTFFSKYINVFSRNKYRKWAIYHVKPQMSIPRNTENIEKWDLKVQHVELPTLTKP